MTMAIAAAMASPTGLLGDTPSRDYSRKLGLFNAFAEPELRRAIKELGLKPGMRILDAGCGTGDTLPWLFDAVKPTGKIVGMDLSMIHVTAARRHASLNIEVIQADLSAAPLDLEAFDLIWCVNTINHLRDPAGCLNRLVTLLRTGGCIALGQSSLLPDMYFAWDARLERVINEAVRRYYRQRYSLQERDLAPVRALVGLARAANLLDVAAHSVFIERISPVDAATQSYLSEAIFSATWGERLRPFLSEDDFAELTCICDPRHPQYALRRPAFHFLQTFTLVTGER